LDQESNIQLGVLSDLSIDGLMFITQQEIPENTKMDIYIENNLVLEGETPVFIKAKVESLWSNPNINPQMHCVGCKILRIEPEDLERLQKLVKSLSFDPAMEIHRTKISGTKTIVPQDG
jgi:hypothetical protein